MNHAFGVNEPRTCLPHLMASLALLDGQRELDLALAVLSAPCEGRAKLPGLVLIPHPCAWWGMVPRSNLSDPL